MSLLIERWKYHENGRSLECDDGPVLLVFSYFFLLSRQCFPHIFVYTYLEVIFKHQFSNIFMQNPNKFFVF